ncbi:nicotinate (nicotinamide) nucleotide adenylyltransferase [Oceanotoga sp. DSM 15011]|jgi:nicotinate-nucleotide adenylyltransferase|uniref:Probable nicotinate-nucleotide adenylyltransferase n=1 Tax=Oceanotoga teriensis TaxID=515440 RepID=A0AA45C4P3_9BACT|nr:MULTISPECIES: nicotinate (nicotinamide) nucleotide adenylyltransferase [Oceanotoga]MDN5341851.1 nicotinate-nucleotide adenylyltransferase [Oceanotoga sp.]MDO7976668.1 nicotinate (nicotinamide) nucleotide adenylyltransferase [Oceanotoga teriensis]PWJ87002.1 nicotinate-nucleotide adenylyltransferase [Oceanotoga teriensis]UYP00685.1 nicotinate (nicotinamide) nucleotide adenylyltransferase [Oceanotoga sp. DSM 15011]
MIIIFGGSFNPPHIAHKIIAEFAYDKFKPDKFLILPASIPPHKESNSIASFQKRFDMCKKTFKSKYFEVSDLENKLKKPSYTVRTLDYLKDFDTNLNLLIGEDSYMNFDKWFEYEKILSFSKLIVYPRFFDRRGFKHKNFEHIELSSPIIDISSSMIRKRIKEKKSIKGLISDDIYNITINTYKIK